MLMPDILDMAELADYLLFLIFKLFEDPLALFICQNFRNFSVSLSVNFLVLSYLYGKGTISSEFCNFISDSLAALAFALFLKAIAFAYAYFKSFLAVRG